MRFWISFLCMLMCLEASAELPILPYSTPDQIVDLTQRAEGIVNPLSGQPCLTQVDLVARGAQDIVLKRTFVSQNRDWFSNRMVLLSKALVTKPPILQSGWLVFPHVRLDYLKLTERRHHRDVVIKS